MTITADTRLTRTSDGLYTTVGADEGVMLSVERGAYYGLNAVACRIYELLETAMTVGELAARLSAEFEIEPAAAEDEVIAFVPTLLENGIISVQ